MQHPEPQNAGAIRFESKDGEPIGIYHAPEDALLNDEGAIDRHFEVKRLASALINSYDPSERGANSVTQLIEDVKNYQVSLGDAPQQENIDFVIPRGDGLRMTLEAQNNIDDISDIPPISDKFKLALNMLVKAHNAYVSFDPVLAKRDRALLGPDAKMNLISPEVGMAVIEDAVVSGIAKEEVAEALGEEAKVAPTIPDAENRKSRRISEGVKNFARKVVADVWGWVKKQVVNNKGKVTIGVAGAAGSAVIAGAATVGIGAGVASIAVTSYTVGKWMLKNEEWFLEHFSNEPKTLQIIKYIYELLKKSPLK